MASQVTVCPVDFPRIHRPMGTWLVGLIITSVIMLGGCPASTPDSGFIVAMGTTTNITGAGTFTSNASCANGQQLVGGGFTTLPPPAVPSAPPPIKNPQAVQSVAIIENYPFSSNTWRVTAQAAPLPKTSNSGTLIAIAYCFVTPNVPLNMFIVPALTVAPPQAPTVPVSLIADATASATCPAGSVLTGGGFSTSPVDPATGIPVNAYVLSEGPTSNSAGQVTTWQMTLEYPNAISRAPKGFAWALCARSHFSPGTVVTGTNTGTYTAITGAVSCPPTSFTVGGGYSFQPSSSVPFSQMAQSSFSQAEGNAAPHDTSNWRIDGTKVPTPTLTATANCIPVPH
jgi:hypothetical protein